MIELKPIPENAVTSVNPDGTLKVLYEPTLKGAEFHSAEEPYVLGEGGRNSGKSHALRWDAHLRCMMSPGFRALLLRRTFPQLAGSHFDQAEREGKLLGCPKPFNRSGHFLEYANGSKLKFGHCESDAAIMDYLSQEWDWIGFDELTTFTFDQFIRISGSARSPLDSGRRAFVRAATNPVGTGAGWVKRYFIDHSVSEEENPKYRPKDWRSIKMNITDNPHADPDYMKRLEMLPSDSLRRAYIAGEWLVEGQFFNQFKENTSEGPWHVIPVLPTIGGKSILEVEWIQIVRTIDWGYSEAEPGYCAWIAMMPDGTAIVFKEWVFRGYIPEAAAERIKDLSKGMKIRFTMGDPMMDQERTGESIIETMGRHGVSIIPANNDRENGWMRFHSWLSTVYNDGTGPRPRLQFLAPQGAGTGLGVPYAIRTLPSLQTDPKKPSDITQETSVEDHAADAIRYWAINRPSPSREPQKTLDHLPRELREAIYGEGNSEGAVLGSESLR